MYSALSEKLVDSVKVPLSRTIKRIKNRGHERYCPVCCSHVNGFRQFGQVPRPNAQCTVCDCLERHRLIWLYFERQTDLFDGRPKRMLHIAPEPQIARGLRQVKYLDYISGDLDPKHAMMQIDITSMPFSDSSFDVVYCSHVLEHVPEDVKAMREFLRVLKPDGWAVLQVPIRGETTLEDPTVVSPEDRARLFGQPDHVRQYGRDYDQRLEQAGFHVRVDAFGRSFDAEQLSYFGLPEEEDVYVCTKPKAA